MPDLQIRNAKQSTADRVEAESKARGVSKSRLMEELIERGLARKPRALFSSGDPEWAERTGEELARGFGTQ